MKYGNYLKSTLAALASGAGGFYLGGRYVGELALPSYTLQKPTWVDVAQSRLWLMLALCAVSVSLWMIVDYRETT